MSVKGFKLSNGTVEKYDYSSLDNILIDDTLALTGVAADAKAVGDEIANLEGQVSDLKQDLESLGNFSISADGTTLIINTEVVDGNEVMY